MAQQLGVEKEHAADTLAALALVYFIVREGREAFHEARTGEMCKCGDDECA